MWGMRRNEESEGGRGREASKFTRSEPHTHNTPPRSLLHPLLCGNDRSVVVVAGKGMTRGHITIIQLMSME